MIAFGVGLAQSPGGFLAAVAGAVVCDDEDPGALA
jgi:hypothetical protein